MKIYTITILRAKKHRWYYHLIGKQVEVVKATRHFLFTKEECYRLYTDKLPIRFIELKDAQTIREREATKQEIYSGKVHVEGPKREREAGNG